MRIVVVIAGLVIAASAGAAAAKLVVLPRPAFPPPAVDVDPGPAQLELVSSRYVSPATSPRPYAAAPASAPARYRGAELGFAIRRPGFYFVVYGGRFLVKTGPRGYELDFRRFMVPPNRGWAEEIRWAREVDGVLYVSHTHLTYATATRGRNAYVTAVDPTSGEIHWRSPALIANARTFVVMGDLIVAGYGFTREDDFLYLLERRTGKVLDRLPVASAPEVITLRGNRLHVRTYDRQVVARIVR